MFSLVAEHFLTRETVIDLILLIVLFLAWLAPEFGTRIFEAAEQFAARLALRRVLAILLVALLTILLRVSLLGLLPVPVPRVHDEFSYLLAADTFAHGRLTNPTHPLWVFFETFHVNQQPTYMSKYPPAQGAVLALGQSLGHPWIGVLLSAAAMCAAILWMLQGWLPARWALLGAMLALCRLAIFGYWMNSYWGGAVAAIGGALVLGAAPRLVHRWKARDAALLALGAVLLANSRPMEGLVLCCPVLIYLLLRLARQVTKENAARLFVATALPFCVVLLLSAAFMGYYNWRGTGSALLFPYVVNEKTYVSTPALFWQKPRPPLRYSNPQFEAFYNGWSRQQWLENRVDSVTQAVRHLVRSGIGFTYFFLWPELCLPFLALPWILRDRRTRLLVLVIVLGFIGFLLAPWLQAHYAAPLTAAVFAVIVQGIRHLRQWKYHGRRSGIGLSRAIVLFAVLLAPFHPYSQALGNPAPSGIEYRAQFEKQLARLPGDHLVIVRYSPSHNVHEEWVYNRADIDGAKIVWAREIPGKDLTPLLIYFHDRTVWLAEPDLQVPSLSPYPRSQP